MYSRADDGAERSGGFERHRIVRGTGLTPNYPLMKINRYICRSVVSLWAFPRIARHLRPSPTHFVFFSCPLPRPPPPPPVPPPFPHSLIPPRCLSAFLRCYLRAPSRHLFDSLKGIHQCLFVYFGLSRTLLPSHPPTRNPDGIQSLRSPPCCAPRLYAPS